MNYKDMYKCKICNKIYDEYSLKHIPKYCKNCGTNLINKHIKSERVEADSYFRTGRLQTIYYTEAERTENCIPIVGYKKLFKLRELREV